MSSCCGSVCLLVLLGIVLAFGSPANYNSERLKQIHNSIADVLMLTKPEIGSNPLFTSVIRSINTSCQRKDLQLMNVTLDVYMRIFSSILQHSHHHGDPGTPALLAELPPTQKSQVVSNLTQLQKKMEKLKSHMCPLEHDNEDLLRNLNGMKVDDLEVQKKALAEYNEIYQAASVIVSRRCSSS